MFTAALFIGKSQDTETTQVPTNRWMDKEDVAVEYYSAIKNNETLPLTATWMDLENIMLSEISQRKTNAV